MTEQTFSAPLETVRKQVQDATQRLLGDTIGISDADWNGPSRLPGWSRAHVAAHLAANADALSALMEATADGDTGTLYPDADSRRADIESGSGLTGLELQIRLDTSAGRLQRSMEAVQDWSAPIDLLGRPLTLAHVPIARLAEVVAHHLDLDCGFGVDLLPQAPARWLLQWVLRWQGGTPDLPAVRLESTSGLVADLGSGDQPRTVKGSDALLWAWLIGRAPADDLEGADTLVLPLRS